MEFKIDNEKWYWTLTDEEMRCLELATGFYVNQGGEHLKEQVGALFSALQDANDRYWMYRKFVRDHIVVTEERGERG